MDAAGAAVLLLRAFYLAASVFILFVQATPALHARFLAYGSRASSHKTTSPSTSSLDRLLDYLAEFQVSHGYFAHFYFLSIGSSLFWAGVFFSMANPSFREAFYASWGHVVWLLMLVQGVRRLFESYPPDPKSKSQMWIGHYFMGLLFYVTVNVAIWVEQVRHIAQIESAAGNFESHSEGQLELKSLPIRSWRLALVPPAILATHAAQHSYHAYLHRLRKGNIAYQLPSHPLFPNLLCPHYSCEVLIYLLLSFLAAPVDHWVNWTLLAATLFVSVNLGVTAVGTKKWYMQQFGAQKVLGRKRMVPFVW